MLQDNRWQYMTICDHRETDGQKSWGCISSENLSLFTLEYDQYWGHKNKNLASEISQTNLRYILRANLGIPAFYLFMHLYHLGELVPWNTLRWKLKSGQAGLIGAKRGQMVPKVSNGAKQVNQGQTDLDCCSIFNSVFMGDLHFSCYFIGHQ